jgi:hypothetical protein
MRSNDEILKRCKELRCDSAGLMRDSEALLGECKVLRTSPTNLRGALQKEMSKKLARRPLVCAKV